MTRRHLFFLRLPMLFDSYATAYAAMAELVDAQR